jgi:hypothetical protein
MNMSTFKRLLLFFFLPVIAILSYPLDYITQGLIGMIIVAVFILGLGWFIWKRNQNALTFSIFLHGMNVIIRLMMLLSTVVNKQGVVNVPFAITGLLGLLLSFYIMLRLDKTDVRKYLETGSIVSSKKIA